MPSVSTHLDKFIFLICLAILLTGLAPRSYAQPSNGLDSQIQEAISRKEYGRAGTLLDQAIAASKPNERRYGVYLATKADLLVQQKLYGPAADLATKAEAVLDKYAPDETTVNNLITLGYATLKVPSDESEGASTLTFEKVGKVLAKLKPSGTLATMGNRLLAIGNELIKPARPGSFALFSATTIFGLAASAFEKGNDPTRAKVARRQSLSLMERIQREEDEEDDDEKRPQTSQPKSKPVAPTPNKKKAQGAIHNPFLDMVGEGPPTPAGNLGNDADWERSLKALTASQQATAYRDRGRSYLNARKNYAKAESYLLQAVRLLKQTDEQNTIGAVRCYDDLALLYVLTNRYANVPAQLRESQKISRDLNQRVFNIIGADADDVELLFDDKATSVGLGSLRLTLSLTAFMQSKPGPYLQQMQQLSYDAALYQNGILLNQARQVRAAIQQQGDARLRQVYTNWLVQKQTIVSTPVSRKDSVVAEAKKIQEELDDLLSERQDIRLNSPEIGWSQIKARLQPKQAAVSFVRFGAFDPATGTAIKDTLYAAQIIRSDCAAPYFVVLGSEHQFLQLLTENKSPNGLYSRGGIVEPTKAVKSAESLYKYVWKPIEAQLKGVTEVYFSVEGLLNQVAFAAIPYPETGSQATFSERYVGGRYKLCQLYSTQQLVPGIQPFRLTANTSAALLGDIDYDAVGAESRPKKAKTLPTKPSLTYLQTLVQQSGAVPFKPLTATRQEVGDIKRLVPGATLLTEANASKKQIRQLAGHSPTLLHIATHAIYVRPPAKRLDNSMDEALMRTALILAGANQIWKSPTAALYADDGLLSAYEIANQDFGQTRLVVLSACETALGDVRGTEGVFGLQRAFRMAGVEKLILSLWPVEDGPTQQFMSLLYSNLKAAQELREAFYNAQIAMQKQDDKPGRWAAFVLLE